MVYPKEEEPDYDPNKVIIASDPTHGLPIGPGTIRSARTVLTAWKNVNFSSMAAGIRYHWEKHVVNQGVGKSIAQYTDDAINFFKTNQDAGKQILLKDGSLEIKIRTPGGGPGGVFTQDGKIVTFWYNIEPI